MMAFALAAAAALAAGAPVAVDAKLLAGLPESEAVLEAHGERQSCTGPALSAVLARVGQPAGEALRGSALARGVLATGRDGYAVLFSLGEFDAMLGGAAAIVATRCDSKSLDSTAGPFRLIVPGEQRPARSVRQLSSLTIVDLGQGQGHKHSPGH